MDDRLQPLRLDADRDVTDRKLAGEVGKDRPVFRYEGWEADEFYWSPLKSRVEGAERVDPALADSFYERFAPARTMPTAYVMDFGASDGATGSHAGRIKECHEQFLCQVCGESILAQADGVGWLTQDDEAEDSNLNFFAPTCTPCMHATLKFCPHFWMAARLEPGKMDLWRISAREGYEWITDHPEVRDNCYARPVEGPHAQRMTLDDFAAHRKQWREAIEHSRAA